MMARCWLAFCFLFLYLFFSLSFLSTLPPSSVLAILLDRTSSPYIPHLHVGISCQAACCERVRVTGDSSCPFSPTLLFLLLFLFPFLSLIKAILNRPLRRKRLTNAQLRQILPRPAGADAGHVWAFPTGILKISCLSGWRECGTVNCLKTACKRTPVIYLYCLV